MQRLKLEQKGLGSDSVFRDNINQSFPSGKGYPFCKTFDPGEFVRSHSHKEGWHSATQTGWLDNDCG